MECVLEKHISIYNEERITSDLIIGRVLKFHIDSDIYHERKIDYKKLDPMSRLEGPNYRSLGVIITIERPK